MFLTRNTSFIGLKYSLFVDFHILPFVGPKDLGPIIPLILKLRKKSLGISFLPWSRCTCVNIRGFCDYHYPNSAESYRQWLLSRGFVTQMPKNAKNGGKIKFNGVKNRKSGDME